MDLYFDNFDVEDFTMAISAFQGAMVTSFLKNRDSLYYYLYVNARMLNQKDSTFFSFNSARAKPSFL